MSEATQVVIVTAAAAGAFLALVRPYLRKSTTVRKTTPSCANCGASSSSAVRSASPSPTTTHR